MTRESRSWLAFIRGSGAIVSHWSDADTQRMASVAESVAARAFSVNPNFA
jgi:hypothetical protein